MTAPRPPSPLPSPLPQPSAPAGPSVGEALIARLARHGVETVFGIPGVHTLELYRGLAGSFIRHVTPRHEQGAGFMADGYARASGKPGVALVISGPGLTNILTAMGQAYGDSIPMLVISAVNAQGRMGSGEGWLHELPDQSAMAAGVAAFSRTIHHPAEMAPALDQAFAVFQAERPRPVHLEIPLNVLAMPAPPAPPFPAPLSRPVPPADALDRAAAMLAGAARPLILAGGGARGAVRGEVAALARLLDAPVVMTTNGRGLLPPGDPLAVPVNPSTAPVRALIAAADVVLALGTEFGPTDYDWAEDGGLRLPGALIRCDLDPQAIRRGVPATLGLIGDAPAVAAALVARLDGAAVPPARRTGGATGGAGRAAAARAALDQAAPSLRGDLALLTALRDALPGAIMAGDSTQMTYAGNTGFAAAAPGRYWSSASGFGTLGYGLPAAIGAAIGAPDAPVIALCGDGGLLFSIGDMAAAVEARANIIMILHDNSGYGEIKTHMRAAGIAPMGVDLATPDFIALARGFGWQAETPATPEALIAAARAAAARRDGPTLIRLTDTLRAGFALQAG